MRKRKKKRWSRGFVKKKVREIPARFCQLSGETAQRKLIRRCRDGGDTLAVSSLSIDVVIGTLDVLAVCRQDLLRNAWRRKNCDTRSDKTRYSIATDATSHS
jgi:hypothetical protein